DFTRLQTVPDDTSHFQCCSLFAVHELPPLRFDGRCVGHYRADACMASGRPTPSSGRRRGCESCIRQAITTSQIIHTTSTTSANTIAFDIVGEKPSEPTIQPCARKTRPESPIRYAIGRGTQGVRTTAAASISK